MSKEFKVRAQLLCKTWDQWHELDEKFIPALGEVCIYTTDFSFGNPANIIFKVGDGINDISVLTPVQAVAADVFAWAKEEHLRWEDMDGEVFIEPLDEHIRETFEHADTKYQIVKYVDGETEVNYKWKLQKNEGDGWVDATGVIDLTGVEARVTNLENSRVLTETHPAGDMTRHIYVNNDGNRAELKYTIDNSLDSAVTVTGTEITISQAAKDNIEDAAKITLNKIGAYYDRNKLSSHQTIADNEIVTWGQVKDLESSTHIRGVATTNPEEAIAPDYSVVLDTGATLIPATGDIVFYNAKEFLYVAKAGANGWRDIGDETAYETKADATAKYTELNNAISTEIAARDAADVALGNKIDTDMAAEQLARTEADTTLQSNLNTEISERVEAVQALDEKTDAAITTQKNRIDQIIDGTIGLEFSHLVQTDGEEIILNCNAE